MSTHIIQRLVSFMHYHLQMFNYNGNKFISAFNPFVPSVINTQSKNFLGRFSDYGEQACHVTSDFCGTALLIIVGPWLAYVAFIERNFPQCGPQYNCLWWDNPTSSQINVGISHALPRSFPSIYPGYYNGVSIENPLLFLNKQIGL